MAATAYDHDSTAGQRPEYLYALMRTALEHFQQPPAELSADTLRELEAQVHNELAINDRILAAPEARGVQVPDSVVNDALAQLRERFADEAQFASALQANGLDRDALAQALRHELAVEAALEKVLAGADAVSDAEVEIYYLQHIERFTLPETRQARQILITLNDEFAENHRGQVLAQLHEIRAALQADIGRFAALAERHSECPSALKEGVLGRIKPGVLYDNLDAALFAMVEGEVSEPLETEVGLHLIYCEKIFPAETRDLGSLKEPLREMLAGKRRKALLRNWLQRNA